MLGENATFAHYIYNKKSAAVCRVACRGCASAKQTTYMDKKNIVALALTTVLGSGMAAAQSFDKLWDNVETSRRADHPKTALEQLAKLRQMAEEQHDAAQLMRVMLTEYGLKGEISPDSAVTTLREMEQRCLAEQHDVVAAMWHFVLAQVWNGVYGAASSEFFDDDTALTEGIKQQWQTLADIAAEGDLLKTPLEEVPPGERAHWLESYHLQAAFYDTLALAEAQVEDFAPLLENVKEGAARIDHRLLVAMLNGAYALVDTYDERPMSVAHYYSLVRQARGHFERAGLRKAMLATEVLMLRVYGGDYLRDVTDVIDFTAEEEALPLVQKKRITSRQAVCARLETLVSSYKDLPEVAEVAQWWCEALMLWAKEQKDPERENALRAQAVDLARRFAKDYPEAAANFKNFLGQNTHPLFDVSWRNNKQQSYNYAFYPKTQVTMPITHRNVKHATLELYRLSGIKGTEMETAAAEDDKTQQRLRAILKRHGAKTPIVRQERHFEVKQDFAVRKDSFELTLPESGVYLMRLKVDGWYDELSPCYVSRGVRLLFNSASRVKNDPEYLIVDQQSGEEVLARSETFPLPTVVKLPFWMQHQHDTLRKTDFRNAEVYTDREVYRPGQVVEASAVVYTQQGDVTRVWPKAQVVLQLLDSQGEKVQEQPCLTDDFGVAAAHFSLPKYCRPGHFSLRLALERTDAQQQELKLDTKGFRVEEYKRPNFAVKFNEVPTHLANTDSLTLRGVAQTFGGIPVANAQLTWKLDIQGWGMWRNGQRDNSNTSLSQMGTLHTDGEGRFEVPLSWKMNPEAFLNLNFSAEVVAPDGEVQSTSFRTWLNRRAESEDNKAPELLEVKENEAGDRATLKVNGSGRLFYRLVSTNRGVVERKSIDVTDGFTFPLEWKASEGYGDAVTAYFYLLKDGSFNTAQMTVVRPRPDKRLQVKWSTFRNTLVPGQQEEWTLSVTHADGRPASANVMARLYDASLDAFLRKGRGDDDFGASTQTEGKGRQSPWQFTYIFPREKPWGAWDALRVGQPRFYPRYPWEAKRAVEFPTVQWMDALLEPAYSFKGGVGLNRYNLGVAASDEYAMPLAAAPKEAMSARMMKTGSAAGDGAAANGLRTNFAETAFFRPTLRTDAAGQTSLRFTLPESLTEWAFDALAFDRELNTGTLSDKIVARKQLSVQVATPRFLREGDEYAWPVTLYNRSAQEQKGKLHVSVTDKATGKALVHFEKTYKLAAGQSLTQAWKWRAAEGLSAVVVTVTAEGNAYSDGEAHEVAVLPRTMKLTVAQPFTVQAGEDYAAAVAKAQQQLQQRVGKHYNKAAVEVHEGRNGMEEVAQLVPQWLVVKDGSAYDQAVNLYGIEAALRLSPQYTPELSNYEAAAYRQSAFDRLKALQNADGGWSWYPGMPTSPYITSQIAVLLARASRYFEVSASRSGEQKLHTTQHINSTLVYAAWKYLDKEVARRMAESEIRGHKFELGEVEMNYLYVTQLLQKKDNATITYCRNLLVKEAPKAFTMYGKALQSVLLLRTEDDAIARSALQSVVEHTVLSHEMGRYFDTERALSGRASYRIPTQVMSMEAIRNAIPQTKIELRNDKEGWKERAQVLLNEMTLWLLQSKRTQVWNNSRATTDAAFALLTTAHATHLNALKWGAVSTTYEAQPEAVAAEGSGFALKRQLEVLRDGEWKLVSNGQQAGARVKLRVGDHVRWTYTVKADRDFDHVMLRSSRPAAFESKAPFSGTTWLDGETAYRMVRDDANEYFFEHFGKGTHTFHDEMVVMRSGTFGGGLSRVECTFAPEFVAHSTSMDVEVTQ